MGGGSNARFDICGNILLKEPPYKFEAGTPAIEAVLGMAKAIEYVQALSMPVINSYEKTLKDYLVAEMQKLPSIIIYNAQADTGIVTFNVEGIFAQDVSNYLSKNGICVRAGNHCAKILLNFLQTSDTLRASLFFYNTKEEVDDFVAVLKNATLENCIDVLFTE